MAEGPEQFVTHLGSFFADIPARLHIPKEAYYHWLVYIPFCLVGVKMPLEKDHPFGFRLFR